jgi:hypothetical protein
VTRFLKHPSQETIASSLDGKTMVKNEFILKSPDCQEASPPLKPIRQPKLIPIVLFVAK